MTNFCKSIYWNLQKASINPKGTTAWEWHDTLRKTTFCDAYVNLKEIREELSKEHVVSTFTDNVHDISIKIESEFKGYTKWDKFKHWSYRVWH